MFFLCLLITAGFSTDVTGNVSLDTEVEKEEDTDSQIVQRRWANSSFLKPLQLSGQLSGFPYLHMLYGIFSCLPVSSASAERALSKLKIVKNRLRTSLSDDNLSALLVLASEKDVVAQLINDDIIGCFVQANPSLKSHLLH